MKRCPFVSADNHFVGLLLRLLVGVVDADEHVLEATDVNVYGGDGVHFRRQRHRLGESAAVEES